MSASDEGSAASISSEDVVLPTPSTAQQEAPSKHGVKANWKASKNYYYWHGHEKERAKLGDVAPLPEPVLVTTEPAATPASLLPTCVKKYSWADGEKSVSIYVEIAEETPAEELDSSTLEVDWKKRSVTVNYTVITSNGTRKKRRLVLHLSNNICPDACTHKIKESSKQIYLKAVKEDPTSWFELTGKPVDEKEQKDNSDTDLSI